MPSSPLTPRILKGGIVLLDPSTSQVLRIITLQYNPDSLTRTLAAATSQQDAVDRSEALRLLGPPVETLKLDAEIDATDQLESPSQNSNTVNYGIAPVLATLELMVYPDSSAMSANNALADAGTLEIIPMEAPLQLFVWNSTRVLPIRLTEFSITEEAFDTSLHPIRAKVSLGMRVLSVTDLGFAHKGGSIYMAYQKQKERLAAMTPSGKFADLGIGGVS